jgi:hypothetical protein
MLACLDRFHEAENVSTRLGPPYNARYVRHPHHATIEILDDIGGLPSPHQPINRCCRRGERNLTTTATFTLEPVAEFSRSDLPPIPFSVADCTSMQSFIQKVQT